VELVGRVDGACAVQQLQRGQLGGAAGLDHGLVFGRVLVGLEQNLVELLADRLRALAAAQLLGPGVDLCLNLLFLLDGGQGLLQDFGRGLLEAALARTTEIVRCVVQAEQRTGLLGQRRGFGKIVTRQVGKAELFLGRKFPGQIQIDLGGLGLALSDQLGRSRLLELEQDIGGLDLDPLARVQLDLGRGFGFGEDAPGQKFAGFFKQCVHNRAFSHEPNIRRSEVIQFMLEIGQYQTRPRAVRAANRGHVAAIQPFLGGAWSRRGDQAKARNSSIRSRYSAKLLRAWSPPSCTNCRA
jgi:hypothetical protein